ncbi:acetyl-CoA synthetase-like protein [Myriangium duriaei CBS 260.36]|uniref:Acetyl-CoA synthetase-like protein n=1 Tax=Myriangium duriaei CBS 260.36 TaxID=1168546 RepID=A0A9P4IZF0_9PEZI|nr:acetyl-CoA synthetase-like protein [Myriangium duriaei CBS 260.36]
MATQGNQAGIIEVKDSGFLKGRHSDGDDRPSQLSRPGDTAAAGSQSRVMPMTSMEMKLREVWANALGLTPEQIDGHDDFFQLCNNLISEVDLIDVSRKAGIKLTVSDVYEHPRLKDMALKAMDLEDPEDEKPIAPFTLLTGDYPAVDALKAQVVQQCNLSGEQQIEDIYPCTSLQEGIMATVTMQPDSYVAKFVFRLSDDVDTARFKAAWAHTLQRCANLRTRIITTAGCTVQAVVREEMSECEDSTNVESAPFQYGTRLCRYKLYVEANGARYLVLFIHHAIFDGWTMQIVLDCLHSFYWNHPPPPVQSFASFVRYLNERDNKASAQYWEQELRGARKTTFPVAHHVISDLPLIRQTMTRNFPLRWTTDSSITKGMVLRAAWAVVLARYCDSGDICFGTTVTGRKAPLAGIKSIAGPIIATLPVRVQLARQGSVAGLLQCLQAQAASMIPHEQFGLRNIAKLSPDAREACDFSCLFVVQLSKGSGKTSNASEVLLEEVQQDVRLQGDLIYPLLTQVFIVGNRVEVKLTFQPEKIPELRIEALLHHFECASQQLMESGDLKVGQISLASHWDLTQAMKWNAVKPYTNTECVQACVHDLIAQHVAQTPEHPAIISSQQGEMTYADLDIWSSRLARVLAQLKIGPEVLVPICLEKSPWAVVAMLGVIKVGGAFVPVDPAHPPARKASLLHEIGANIILVSHYTEPSCRELKANIIQVSVARLQSIEHAPVIGLAKPFNAAYAIFTSGSTGKPKTIVVEHQGVCTSLMSHGKVIGMCSTTRFLQFSNYTFDMCITEILGTLIFGGCVCIPSEFERLNDTSAFMAETRVNTAFLTPSFANTLDLTSLSHLHTLLIGGEALTKGDLNKWFGNLRLFQAYGPTETVILCTLHEVSSREATPATIGYGVGNSCWLVDPNDHHLLAPIGCVGELLIHGALARGYANDVTGTEQAFLKDVKWLPRSSDQDTRRYYKTGDLAVYNTDGTIEFLGRKDIQVKIRGQRTVVEVIQAERGPILVAFVTFDARPMSQNEPCDQDLTQALLLMDDHLRTKFIDLSTRLEQELPHYMVPTLYLPMRWLPRGSSFKLDRKRLRELAHELSPGSIASYSLARQDYAVPTTDMELQLRELWVEILKVPLSDVCKHSNFLQIGGDSVSSMHLVSLSRKDGLSLTVQDVFDDPRLSSMAKKVESRRHHTPVEMRPIAPFSLLEHGIMERDSLKTKLIDHCGIMDLNDLEDGFPCTALQEGLMALTATRPGSYIARFVYLLPEKIDIDRFKTAWERTIHLCDTLRARILQVDGMTIQILSRHDIQWEKPNNMPVSQMLERMRGETMGYGTSLCRYSLVGPNESGENYFILAMHHAVFDGWSLRMVMRTLQSAYCGSTPPPLQPFASFVQHVCATDTVAMQKYWQTRLEGAKQLPCPMIDAKHKNVTAFNAERTNQTLSRTLSFFSKEKMSITDATILHAAWAIVLGQYCQTDDVCFGTIVSGRQAALDGINQISGPTIATVPVRIRIPPNQTVLSFLEGVQSQMVDMVPYEQFGLQNIAKVTSEAKLACDFSCLLILQPACIRNTNPEVTDSKTEQLDELVPQIDTKGYDTYPLVVECYMHRDNAELKFSYYSDVVSEERLIALTHHLENIVRQLVKHHDHFLSDVHVAGEWDLQWAMKSNLANSHSISMSACVQDLIAGQANSFGDCPAILSSDGGVTYAELEHSSGRLAAHLCKLGVGPESLIPLCFEKSALAIVAMLGVLKAGAAFVCIDCTHPPSQQSERLKQIDAQLLLVSSVTAAICREFDVRVVELSLPLLSSPTITGMGKEISKTDSSNAAYAIFTSGSRGAPKLVVVEHGSMCLSLKAHTRAFGVDHQTRFLQFSNYTFDVCISEIFGTLMAGGTVCVPSEYERLHGIVDFIRRFEVTTADLTPTFLATIPPGSIPSVITLVVGGEPCGPELLRAWLDHANIIHTYGLTEACITSTTFTFRSADDRPSNIGRPLNGPCWIVDPDDHNRLAPIGCIGELIIRGPVLARGYLGDTQKTEASFISGSHFLPDSAGHRFYKTGDLVKYNADGTIDFVGRQDTQVKIRGQRVELGAIEHSIRSLALGSDHIVVDLVKYQEREILIAFISVNGPSAVMTEEHTVKLVETNDRHRTMFAEIFDQLQGMLPSHLVPSLFVPFIWAAFGSSMKLDRKLLRRLVQRLSSGQLTELSLRTQPKITPRTTPEFNMRSLWAKVLRLPESSIGVDDSFESLGGNSITLVTLVQLINSRENSKLVLAYIDTRTLTVSTLADLVETTRHSGNGQCAQKVQAGIDLMEEINSHQASIQKELPTDDRPIGGMGDRNIVFLTGGTGYLGTEILRQLLSADGVGSVIVLVRAPSVQEGLARIIRAAKIAGWWEEDKTSMIKALPGDLALKRCGQDDKIWHDLCYKVNVIVHNGAVVNWIKSYYELRDANVLSTTQLLELTASSPLQPKFIYISGGKRTRYDLDRATIANQLAQASQANGYVQSKFVAESVVSDFISRLHPGQRQVFVVKPGLIIGGADKGVANVDDFLWRIVAGAVDLHAYPLEREDQWLLVADEVKSWIKDKVQFQPPIDPEMTQRYHKNALDWLEGNIGKIVPYGQDIHTKAKALLTAQRQYSSTEIQLSRRDFHKVTLDFLLDLKSSIDDMILWLKEYIKDDESLKMLCYVYRRKPGPADPVSSLEILRDRRGIIESRIRDLEIHSRSVLIRQ